MICSQCGREIADGSLSCNYCGKIFVNKRPVGGRVTEGPSAVAEARAVGAPMRMQEAIDQTRPITQASLNQAVTMRRYQRWGFYVLIIIIFLLGVFYVNKISNDNSDLLNQLTSTKTAVKTKEAEIARQVDEITKSNQKISNSSATLTEVQANLTKTNDALLLLQEANKKSINDLEIKNKEFTDLKANAGKNSAVIRNFMLELGVPISATNLSKISYATIVEVPGDTDKDGIPDALEPAFGTDPNLYDTDKDGFSDRDEINNGYNPLGEGKMPVDEKVVKQYKGKAVLLKDNTDTYAWYVASNGKRYFLGKLSNDFIDILDSAYWTK